VVGELLTEDSGRMGLGEGSRIDRVGKGVIMIELVVVKKRGKGRTGGGEGWRGWNVDAKGGDGIGKGRRVGVG
jgi:hypothetical protein